MIGIKPCLQSVKPSNAFAGGVQTAQASRQSAMPAVLEKMRELRTQLYGVQG